jgi:glycosyltransferase involved in cell wall biosynthesis
MQSTYGTPAPSPPVVLAKRKIRIAVLNSHPIQYFAPLYRFLNASPNLAVTALYSTNYSLRGGMDQGFGRSVTWDIDLLSGYDAVFLGSRSKKRVPKGFFSLVVPEVWTEIRSGRYDVLWLHGHSYLVNFIALAAAKSCGVFVFMRSETHLGLKRGPLKKLIRKVLMRVLYSLCDRCVAIGTANQLFYKEMGVPDDKLFLAPYSVDNARLIEQSNLRPAQRQAVQADLGIRLPGPVILFAAKLSRRKHPDDLVRAAALLRARGLSFTLLMVGSGELEPELRRLAAELDIDNVVWAGFRNQSELPAIYGVSDIFVLPSEDEPWGLAVNEAMCGGLAIVVADGIGCVPDLLKRGGNGFCFPAGNIDALASSLERLIVDKELRTRCSAESRRIIERWSYVECLNGLTAALKSLPIVAPK